MLRVLKCLRSVNPQLVLVTLLVISSIGGGVSTERRAGKTIATAAVDGNSAPPMSKPQTQTGSEITFPQITSSAFDGPDRVWLVDPSATAVLRTQDSGSSWQKFSVNEINWNTLLDFIDENNGWLIGNSDRSGQVWHTSDGGKTWAKLSTVVRDQAAGAFTSAVQLHFVDRLNGWLIETFGVWRTEDGGVSWSEVLSTDDRRLRGQPGRGFFASKSQASIAGGNGQVYQTADGGKTWKIQTIDDQSEFSDIFFIDDRTGWLSRNYRGQLYRTDDGGRSWVLQPPLAQDMYIDSCYFISKDEGWGVGQQLLPGSQGLLPSEYMSKGLVRPILLHTLDGGRTWQLLLTEDSKSLFGRVYFSDTKHGWLVSSENLYRSSDGGHSWQVAVHLHPSASG